MFEVDHRVQGELLPHDSVWLHEVERHIATESFASALQQAEAHAKGSDSSKAAAASYAMAKVRYAQGQHGDAKAAAEDALAKFRTLGDGRGEAIALHALAQINLEKRSDVDVALKQATEALTQFQKAQSGKGEAAVMNTLAKIHYLKEDPSEALKQADLAQQTFKGMDDQVGEAAALTTRATILLLTGNFSRASVSSREAVSLCKGMKTPSARLQEASALLVGSAAAIPRGMADEALKAAQEANKLCIELGGPCGKAKSLRALAFCNLMVAEVGEAVNCVETALPLVAGHAGKSIAASLLSVGALAYRQKLSMDRTTANEGTAVRMARDALACYQELGDEKTAALVRIDLAHTHTLCGNMSEALDEARKSQEAFERLGEKSGEGIATLTLSELQFNVGNVFEAIDLARKAQGLLSDPKLSTVDGAKEVDKVLHVMQSGSDQKKSSKRAWVAPPRETYMEGYDASKDATTAMGKATYSLILSNALKGVDRPEELVFSAEGITNTGNLLGISIPFLRTWAQQPGSSAAVPGAAAPASAPVPASRRAVVPPRQLLAATLERLVEVPKEADRDPFEAATELSTRPSIVGSDDVLGGRVWGCPEELHNRMLALAKRGDMSKTTPKQRENLCNRRPTFHGSAQWKEACKWGYIHPDLAPPPVGTRWMKVAVGWKLIEEATAVGEQSTAPAPRLPARSTEPLGSMTLHAILQAACPGWKDNDVITVRRKLKKIQIERTSTLLEVLQGGKPEDLNARLKAIGEKAFRDETLNALVDFCGSMR